MKADQADLHVEDEGEGVPTLILLHYFAGSSRAWAPVSARLRSRLRCMSPDLAGFGRSRAAAPRDTVSAYADDVERLLEPVGPCVLAGHSMGGKIAVAVAARRPPGLLALILLAPSPPTPEPISDTDRRDLLAAHGSRSSAETQLRKVTHSTLPADVLARAVEDSLASSPQAWRWWLDRGSRETLAASGPLDIPVLLLAGEKDAALPLELHAETARRLGASGMEVIPDCGHLLPLEAPDEVGARILRFVEALEAPSGR